MSESSPNLAQQALANLVDQFARPLDFLRELAQNSIDAGSPRIDVSIDFIVDEDTPGRGVLQIHVDDYGEGMDEPIIDNQLTRLFSSTKEDDLTKIGKFGIGFTSVFAIRPDAILLQTGRHGEYWELIFHADRTFEKRRIDTPVVGTRITLYKRMDADEASTLAQDARFVLGYWCEHSDVPITWWDKSDVDASHPTDPADPFAAFTDTPASSAGADQVNRPLDLDAADLVVRHTEGETEVVVGLREPPTYGYYNGGLTLLQTRSPDALGDHAHSLQHVSFKVKNDRLEHTLTRDSVLHDGHWATVMEVVGRARARLVERLLDRTEEAARTGAPVDPWHAWLARECATRPPRERTRGLEDRALFRDAEGHPRTLDAVRTQESELDFVLLASGNSHLDRALVDAGYHLLTDTPALRRLLKAATHPSIIDWVSSSNRSQRLMRADEAFVLPQILPAEALTETERSLVERTVRLLRHAAGIRVPIPLTSRALSWSPAAQGTTHRIGLRVGDFGGLDLGREDALVLDGPGEGKVFLRSTRPWRWVPTFLRRRTLLVNRHHALFRTLLLAAVEDLEIAALGLAQALLEDEGLEPERTFRKLVEGTLDDWEAGR